MAISKLAEFVRSAEGEGTLKDLVALGLVKCAHREKLCALVDGTCQSMDNKGRCLRGCPACFLILKGVVISSHETNRFS